MPKATAAKSSSEWVLLSYRLPREPSTPRISLWRRLKRYGVVQVGDGLVALPADARTREQFDWAAEQALDAGGTATVWLAKPTAAVQERTMAQEMAEARAREYAALAELASRALALPAAEQSRTLRRLRSQWREITRRDFFPPPQREVAAAALRALRDSEAAAWAPGAPAGRSVASAGSPAGEPT